MGGTGYYNILYKYLIMYAVDYYYHVFTSTIMYLGWAAQHNVRLIIPALEVQEHVLLVIVIVPHVLIGKGTC